MFFFSSFNNVVRLGNGGRWLDASGDAQDHGRVPVPAGKHGKVILDRLHLRVRSTRRRRAGRSDLEVHRPQTVSTAVGDSHDPRMAADHVFCE